MILDCLPYSDSCPICTQPLGDPTTATDHLVGVHDGPTVKLAIVHQPCLVQVGKNIFRDTQARLKRMKCVLCDVPLTYHTIASASVAGPAFMRCSDGRSFEAAA